MSIVHNPKKLSKETQLQLLRSAALARLGLHSDSNYTDINVERSIHYALKQTAKAGDKSFWLLTPGHGDEMALFD